MSDSVPQAVHVVDRLVDIDSRLRPEVREGMAERLRP
jgi:hypothetical protein